MKHLLKFRIPIDWVKTKKQIVEDMCMMLGPTVDTYRNGRLLIDRYKNSNFAFITTAGICYLHPNFGPHLCTEAIVRKLVELMPTNPKVSKAYQLLEVIGRLYPDETLKFCYDA